MVNDVVPALYYHNKTDSPIKIGVHKSNWVLTKHGLFLFFFDCADYQSNTQCKNMFLMIWLQCN